jgi:leader peptidase (prepilin peptidase)/N-methyltransferase
MDPIGMFVALLAALLGATVGSFCNVVILRLPRMLIEETSSSIDPQGLSLSAPRSHCPKCLHPLHWHQLMPVVSFFWLKGRCAHCNESISPRYWRTEVLVSLWWLFCAGQFQLFKLSALAPGLQPLFYTQATSALLWALMGSALICLAQIDWEHQLLPDAITQPFLWLGLLGASCGFLGLSAKDSLWGAALGYLSFWGIAKIYLLFSKRDGMGQGDMKLLALFGAWLGPLSLIPLVLLASTSGAGFGLWRLKITKNLGMNDPIPFGPFLIASAFALLLLGPHQVLHFLALMR